MCQSWGVFSVHLPSENVYYLLAVFRRPTVSLRRTKWADLIRSLQEGPGHELTHAWFVRHTTLCVNNGHGNNLISVSRPIVWCLFWTRGKISVFEVIDGQKTFSHFDFLYFSCPWALRTVTLFLYENTRRTTYFNATCKSNPDRKDMYLCMYSYVRLAQHTTATRASSGSQCDATV